ncbi:TorF family putative porin [Gillisia marina]|uniref:TorF family putative porin n=1 Tax=Gillisia marina TaxID=1167637 RepID=UPI00029AD21F|nr:TorF family putative porin [Gillisia marina]
MKSTLPFLLIFSFTGILNAQYQESLKDTIEVEKESSFSAQVDILNQYLWRGQSYGGKYVAAQPSLEYAITDNLSIGIWATTNFQKLYYETDELTPRAYQELDLGISYALNNFITIELWDYYYPSVEKFDDEDTSIFNFGDDGVQTLDALLIFDFSEIWLPLEASISTFIAGNDYRYDSDEENPKQNFTTYVELNYYFEDVLAEIEINPFAGAVLNNQAEYYEYADFDKVSFINLGVALAREFSLNNDFSVPVNLKYIHNAATENTDIFGRNFIVAGIALVYN